METTIDWHHYRQTYAVTTYIVRVIIYICISKISNKMVSNSNKVYMVSTEGMAQCLIYLMFLNTKTLIQEYWGSYFLECVYQNVFLLKIQSNKSRT